LHPDDAVDVLEQALAEGGLELRRRVIGARLRQRRRRPADEHVSRRSRSFTRPRGGLKVELPGRSEKTPAPPSNGM
jgi:hypothetical protein